MNSLRNVGLGRQMRWMAAITAIATMAALLTATSGAGAALTAPEAGEVVRGGALTLREDTGAQSLDHNGNPYASLGTTCGAASSNPSAASVAHSTITVTDPTGAVAFAAVSPPRYLGKYLGILDIYDRGGAWSTQWVIPEDAPAGTYRASTTTVHRRKNASFGTACTNLAPVETSSVTFEYRPFQHRFHDLLGNGSVGLNTTPGEFQFTVGTKTSGIQTDVDFYSVPDGTVLLPSDPAACAAAPQTCLPPTAVACDPPTGCTPRVAVVNGSTGSDRLVGVFDLGTKAFVADASISGTQRFLFSLGADGDDQYRALVEELSAAATAQGIDVASLLRTTVHANTGDSQIRLSLLNGLQIDPGTAPAGVQLSSDARVQAGIVLNIFSVLEPTPCTTMSGDSDPGTAAPERFVPDIGVGYTVERSDLLPSVPRAGAVGALVGGPIYHIEGNFDGAGDPLVNTSTAVIGADTSPGEPNGYPVWVEPFLSTPANSIAARTMDFLGTATWSASQTSILTSCLVIDFMLGAGVAIYDNPLPVGLGDLGVWDPQSPEVVALISQVDAAVQDGVDQVVGNPVVGDLLDQVVGLVPTTGGLPL